MMLRIPVVLLFLLPFFGIAHQIFAQQIADTAFTYTPEHPKQFEENSPFLSGDGYYQGACLSYGKGRLVVMGEAAMFSAQLAGPNRNQVGMNTPEAAQNAQFLLNIMHWLDE